MKWTKSILDLYSEISQTGTGAAVELLAYTNEKHIPWFPTTQNAYEWIVPNVKCLLMPSAASTVFAEKAIQRDFIHKKLSESQSVRNTT